MFYLYYLADQSGDINGDKSMEGVWGSLEDAQAQAATDSIAHYSVEQDMLDGLCSKIIYIV